MKNKNKENHNMATNIDANVEIPSSDQNEAISTAQASEEAIDETSALLEEKDRLYAETLDRLQRSLAEFDNFRKRTIKEKAGMYDDGVRDTVEKLLPIIDNFERAIVSTDNKEDGFYKGIEMILRQLQAMLEDLGVSVILCVGQTLDTRLHFAVAHVEDEKYGSQEIIQEMQKGYICRDKVIRCSMVKVAN